MIVGLVLLELYPMYVHLNTFAMCELHGYLFPKLETIP